MSENLQLRIEVQCAIKNLIENFMNTNNVSASMMDDAISKVLLDIKEKALQEFLVQAQQSAAQQAALAEQIKGTTEEEE